MARGSYVQEEQFLDHDFDVVVKIKEPIITVQLTDVSSGITSRGSAKRNDPDRFSVEIGRRIAFARALGRFARRLEKQTIRNIDIAAS